MSECPGLAAFKEEFLRLGVGGESASWAWAALTLEERTLWLLYAQRPFAVPKPPIQPELVVETAECRSAAVEEEAEDAPRGFVSSETWRRGRDYQRYGPRETAAFRLKRLRDAAALDLHLHQRTAGLGFEEAMEELRTQRWLILDVQPSFEAADGTAVPAELSAVLFSVQEGVVRLRSVLLGDPGPGGLAWLHRQHRRSDQVFQSMERHEQNHGLVFGEAQRQDGFRKATDWAAVWEELSPLLRAFARDCGLREELVFGCLAAPDRWNDVRSALVCLRTAALEASGSLDHVDQPHLPACDDIWVGCLDSPLAVLCAQTHKRSLSGRVALAGDSYLGPDVELCGPFEELACPQAGVVGLCGQKCGFHASPLQEAELTCVRRRLLALAWQTLAVTSRWLGGQGPPPLHDVLDDLLLTESTRREILLALSGLLKRTAEARVAEWEEARTERGEVWDHPTPEPLLRALWERAVDGWLLHRAGLEEEEPLRLPERLRAPLPPARAQTERDVRRHARLARRQHRKDQRKRAKKGIPEPPEAPDDASDEALDTSSEEGAEDPAAFAHRPSKDPWDYWLSVL